MFMTNLPPVAVTYLTLLFQYIVPSLRFHCHLHLLAQWPSLVHAPPAHSTMPPKFEIRLKGVLVTCVGFLASSLGVFAVRLLQISSVQFTLTSERFAEHTRCHRLATVFPVLNAQTHLYRRWEDRSHTEATTPLSEIPSSPCPPAIVGSTFIQLVEYPLERQYNQHRSFQSSHWQQVSTDSVPQRNKVP